MEENRTRSSAAGEKRRTWGFTLVELIIVIAILAVLAGVAYPVYTGYITKANEAADLALLGQVNESFTSALYDVGYNDGLPEAAGAALTDDYKLTEVWSDDVSAGNDALNTAFLKYFEGNQNTPFKVYKGLGYSRGLGGFYGMLDDGSITTKTGMKMKPPVVKNGKTTVEVELPGGETVEYTLDNVDKDSFGNSSFGTEMSMPELLGEVDNVVQALKGVLVTGGTPEQLEGLLGADYLESLGLKKEDYAGDNDAYLQALTNAVVMNVADASAGLTADDVINNTQKWQDFGSDNLLAMMAATYGIATGYANSDIGKNSNITYNGETMTVKEYYDKQSQALRELTNPTDAIGIIFGMLSDIDGSEGMDEYRDSGAYAEDLNGYFSAMNALSGNRDALVSQGVLDSGFTDEDLGAILDALFGN